MISSQESSRSELEGAPAQAGPTASSRGQAFDAAPRRYPFIVLEGLDGVGKTTVAAATARRLNARGMPAIAVCTPRYPFKATAAEVIRDSASEARFLFFLAAVYDCAQFVLGSLPSSAIVCDRYVFSTIAYHEAIGVDTAAGAPRLPLLLPDHGFLLDAVDTSIRLSRMKNRSAPTQADEEFARIEREAVTRAVFSRFGLTYVDVSVKEIEEVVDSVVALVESAQWPRACEYHFTSTHSLVRRF